MDKELLIGSRKSADEQLITRLDGHAFAMIANIKDIQMRSEILRKAGEICKNRNSVSGKIGEIDSATIRQCLRFYRR